MRDTLRVVTLNMNGIRAAARKGFFDWLQRQDVDIVCLQEIRADETVLQHKQFHPAEWHVHYVPAQGKKGYSGVGIYSRVEPDEICDHIGHAVLDEEGRYCACRFDDLWVASLYLPSGTSGDARQQVKYDCMAFLERKYAAWATDGHRHIVCGDYNIAHTEADIKNWRANQNHSGFLPEERAWMDALLGDGRWYDAFRRLPQPPDQYTWWSNRGRARENNVGWRIDYHIISAAFADAVRATAIEREQRFSDHAPCIITYQLLQNT